MSGFAALLTAHNFYNNVRSYSESVDQKAYANYVQFNDFVQKLFQTGNELGESIDEVWPHEKLGPKCHVLGIGTGLQDSESKHKRRYFIRDHHPGNNARIVELEDLVRMGEDARLLQCLDA